METKNYATFFGGEEIEVRFLNSDVKRVKVKQLPVRAFPDFAINIDNEPKLIELLTDLSPDEVDNISQESWVKILELGEKLNHDPFSAWLKRKIKRAENQMQILVGNSGANSSQV